MEITGIIEKVLKLELGITKDNKEWQKQNFIVANNDGFEGKRQIFCFEIFGEEKVQNFNKFNKEGDTVKVDFNISTNEWVNPQKETKYFTSLQAWKVFKETSNETKKEGEAFQPKTNLNEEEPDDLPF